MLHILILTTFCIVTGIYTRWQYKTGKSLTWFFGEQVTRESCPGLYWSNVFGSGLVSTFSGLWAFGSIFVIS